jgi:glutamyl-tRNA synthetase
MEKLSAFNGEYVRKLSAEEFIQARQTWFRPRLAMGSGGVDEAVFRSVAGLAQTRITVLSEITNFRPATALDREGSAYGRTTSAHSPTSPGP